MGQAGNALVVPGKSKLQTIPVEAHAYNPAAQDFHKIPFLL